jgi:hypothetical protein
MSAVRAWRGKQSQLSGRDQGGQRKVAWTSSESTYIDCGQDRHRAWIDIWRSFVVKDSQDPILVNWRSKKGNERSAVGLHHQRHLHRDLRLRFLEAPFISIGAFESNTLSK